MLAFDEGSSFPKDYIVMQHRRANEDCLNQSECRKQYMIVISFTDDIPVLYRVVDTPIISILSLLLHRIIIIIFRQLFDLFL